MSTADEEIDEGDISFEVQPIQRSAGLAKAIKFCKDGQHEMVKSDSVNKLLCDSNDQDTNFKREGEENERSASM